jgi:hypothetical protein
VMKIHKIHTLIIGVVNFRNCVDARSLPTMLEQYWLTCILRCFLCFHDAAFQYIKIGCSVWFILNIH